MCTEGRGVNAEEKYGMRGVKDVGAVIVKGWLGREKSMD